MKLTLAFIALMAILSAVASKEKAPKETGDDRLKQLEKTLQELTEQLIPAQTLIKELKQTQEQLSRQVMLQQFYMEEKVRSDGNSGIKAVRTTRDGTKNYFEVSHVSQSFCSIHDHANYNNTVGMGELLLVMNGVEFKTRHNDYKLRMPSPTEKTYNKMVDIPLSPVPESVLNKKSVEEQIAEMQEYFRAFKEQNPKIRDYKPFFKPVLCYVEATWTTSTKSVDEPFESDRHAIDAASWMGLMEKVRFTSYTGSKSVQENFSFLPTTIMEVVDGVPQYAQWNYRIVCHPLKEDLPLKYFTQLDDLKYRLSSRLQWDNTGTRSERFYLNEKKIDHFDRGFGIMDKIMAQIPGKDNYGAFLRDDSLGMDSKDLEGNDLNTAYYHRYFSTDIKGAMGSKNVHRGFTDANLWVAQTTHAQVAPMSVETKHCKRIGHSRKRVCQRKSVRYTYALPLEIIYMTPLQSWNPYDIEHKESVSASVSGVLTGPNGTRRTGGHTEDTAWNGAHGKKVYYLTPSEFYSAGTVDKDKADTAMTGAGVLDRNGTLRICDSSGIRIRTPSIGGGVGSIRLRYPIMQVHGEGSGVWKELNALKDMTMHMNRYRSLYEDSPLSIPTQGDNTSEYGGLIRMKTSVTVRDPPGEHYHQVIINEEEADAIRKGEPLLITTSEAAGHSHQLTLRAKKNGVPHFKIHKCDGKSSGCWDGHNADLFMSDD